MDIFWNYAMSINCPERLTTIVFSAFQQTYQNGLGPKDDNSRERGETQIVEKGPQSSCGRNF